MPKGIYYQLRSLTTNHDGQELDRRVWTFESETDANLALEFFITHGNATPDELYIQEVERT
jgi:hypothetical protein